MNFVAIEAFKLTCFAPLLLILTRLVSVDRPINRRSPSGDRDHLVCLEDGLWSFPEAYCKIECPGVPTVANARLLTPDCAASGHDVGAMCRYKCSTGYYVAGSLKKKTPK